jgi:hypothetical protein
MLPVWYVEEMLTLGAVTLHARSMISLTTGVNLQLMIIAAGVMWMSEGGHKGQLRCNSLISVTSSGGLTFCGP